MKIPFFCVLLSLGCGGVGGERGGSPDQAGGAGAGAGGGAAAGADADGGEGAGDAEGGENGAAGGGVLGGGEVGGQEAGGPDGGDAGEAGGEAAGDAGEADGGQGDAGGQAGEDNGGEQGDAAGQGEDGQDDGGDQGDPGGEQGGDDGGVDAGPRPAADLTGVVNVTQVFVIGLNVQPFRGNGAAFFTETGARPEANGCELVQNGDGAPTPSAHAGVITVGGGSQDLVLTPTRQANGDWAYVSNLRDDNERLYDEGDRLTFRGAGGPHVGPFDHAMEAPRRVDIDSPTAFNKPRERSSMRVRWNGEGETAALISVTPANGDFVPTEPVGNSAILCGAADNGDLTVPAELMGQLPGSDGVIISVSRIRAVEHDLDADTHLVLTAVMSSGMAVEYQ